MAQLLGRIHTRDGALHRTVLRTPYALEIQEQAALSIMVSPEVDIWHAFGDSDPTCVPAGRVMIVARPVDYRVGTSPDGEVRYVIRGEGAYRPDGTLLPPSIDDVHCLVEPAGDTVLISGIYDVSAGLGDRLLAALPPLAVVDLPEWATLVALLTAELTAARPGRQTMLDRWLDLVLVSALRTWFEQAENVPGWYAARADAVVGPALEALHENPGDPWTTESLARLVASSRSGFSARFTRLVGEPPMTYLTRLRIDVATEQLLSDDASLETIAARVGYASAFALSAAYKRQTGVSPSQVRRRASAPSLLRPGAGPLSLSVAQRATFRQT